MATGTGKTVVMAMLIAWSVLNKVTYRQAKWCSDAVLLVAPGVTVKDRLRVLIPEERYNYYERFDLVPTALRSLMGCAHICILHRQEMALRDDSGTKSVVKLGAESDGAFANRLLKTELGSKQRILVINDEGHHCYRPRETQKNAPPRLFGEETPAEIEKENKRAAQWITWLKKSPCHGEF